MSDPFVIIGGDAAGLSAASKFARENPDGDVVVFERGRWISYAHCGTPYYVKGEVDRLTDLLSLSPEAAEERGIDLRREHEVVAIDTDAQTVTVESSGDGESFEQPYGNLLVGTGAHAITDPIPGSRRDMAFTMHGLDSAAAVRAALSTSDEAAVDTDIEYVDADLVEKYADREPPERVAVVGGGYVGIEMAEAFHAHGLETHLFQRSSHLLPPFGEAVGERVADHLRERGIELHLDTAVSELAGGDSVETVVHEDGRVSVGLALVGVGIEPNTDLLSETPVELGESGAVAVDEYGRTTAENVYAAGDCAEDRHAVTGEPTWVPLGLTANRAGRAIGQTVASDPEPVGDVAGTAVVKALELECGRVGFVGDESARDAGFEPVTTTITAGSRSGYYPGGDETTVTLTADRGTGRLLGGAIVGRDRAAIRIDTLSTALESNLSVAELERLDLAYAPPFSPVWDPVLVAAKVLRGELD